MKALSIRQPWLWDILHNGKDVENRQWYTDYRGLLFLHAGRRPANNYPHPWPNNVPKGGIVGIVELVDVVTDHVSKWYKPGMFGFVFKNPRIVPYMECKGMPGLFDIDYKL